MSQMDDATRAAFLERIKREVLKLSEHDHEVMKHAMTVVMQMTSDPRLGAVTMLMPSAEAIARIDNEDELTPELCERLLGLFLDQVILGILPPPSECGDHSGRVMFSTLGGASATLESDGGKLFLTDSNGRRVGLSDPVMDKPKLACRISDDFLMLDDWADRNP